MDTIDREEKWKCLYKMEIPTTLVKVIKSTYEIVRCQIQIGRRKSEVLMKMGMKQGDCLSPLLCILVNNKIINEKSI